MKNSLRAAAFCAGVVAGVAWLTSSGMRCFVAVVRCFMRLWREVEEAFELFYEIRFSTTQEGGDTVYLGSERVPVVRRA